MEREYKAAQPPFSTAAGVRLLKRVEKTANGIAQLSPTTPLARHSNAIC